MKVEPQRTRRGRAAERFLTTENTEQHGKEIRMCFHFCVPPCFPWLLPVLTIGAARDETFMRTEITEGRGMI